MFVQLGCLAETMTPAAKTPAVVSTVSPPASQQTGTVTQAARSVDPPGVRARHSTRPSTVAAGVIPARLQALCLLRLAVDLLENEAVARKRVRLAWHEPWRILHITDPGVHLRNCPVTFTGRDEYLLAAADAANSKMAAARR